MDIWCKLPRKKWEALKAKAQAGDSDAQWQVGSWLQEGLLDSRGRLLVRPRPSAGARWFRKSAMAGNANGQNNLAVCLSGGYGVPRDEVEALHWFQRAFRQGYPVAAANIASVYKDCGNNRRAMFWYQRAAARGDGEAWVEVGRGYYKGVGVRADPGRAVRCFRKAIASKYISQAGREDAMFHLGLAFYEGRGAIKSNALALNWLAKANIDDDHAEARKLIEKVSKVPKLPRSVGLSAAIGGMAGSPRLSRQT